MKSGKKQPLQIGSCTALAVLACLVLLADTTQAAYISEIDLGGPAGQGIELSQFDSAASHTLLIIDANPTSFGRVFDVIHLPASIGLAGVAMVTETPWPDTTAHTTTLASLNPALGDDKFAFNGTRLLVVMQGQSEVEFLDNPLSDAQSATNYVQSDVVDWLVLTDGDPATLYQARADIADINAAFGIDLLSRVVSKSDGRVIGRTNVLENPLDMDVFFVGDPDPDTGQQFDVPGGYRYTYTPSMSNLPLSQAPEPSSLALLALTLGVVWRRPAKTR